MNIMIVDQDPEIAGKILPDKLICKLCVEDAQMLSTSCRVCGVDDDRLYKITHLNHPCSKWTRQTQGNFIWLYLYSIAMCKEYTARYGRVHASQRIIELCGEYLDFIPQGDLTPFVTAMPDEISLKHINDPCAAYREFIKTKPYWFKRWKPYNKGYNYEEYFSS